MFSLSVVTWMGTAAAVFSGQWGAVSRRAQEVGGRREAMDQQARRVDQAGGEERAGGPSREALLAEHPRFCEEHRLRWELLDEAESLATAVRQQCAATAWALGGTLGQIVTLLALVLPACRVPSRATVGRWVEQAGRQAGGLLTVLDRVCQVCVVTLCLDEIFFHRDPVLGAVEPHSMAWVAGQRGPDRPGDRWCRVLQQWPSVVRVVRDAGTGLARGVKLLHEARAGPALAPDHVPGPPVQGGVDVLHTERERQRVIGRQWARGEQLVDTAAPADQQVAHATPRGIDARGAAGRARAAWGKAERAVDEAVPVEAAVERLRAALACVRPDGPLKDRAWAQGQITDALGALGGEAWSTVRRLLDETRTLHHVDWRQAQLVQAVPDPQ